MGIIKCSYLRVSCMEAIMRIIKSSYLSVSCMKSIMRIIKCSYLRVSCMKSIMGIIKPPLMEELTGRHVVQIMSVSSGTVCFNLKNIFCRFRLYLVIPLGPYLKTWNVMLVNGWRNVYIFDRTTFSPKHQTIVNVENISVCNSRGVNACAIQLDHELVQMDMTKVNHTIFRDFDAENSVKLHVTDNF